jgi:general secretion pathway protein A
MYYQYFGLQEAPFSIAVNPRYLYMSPRHRDALAHLLYGFGAGGGFILLTGEVGTGKTTLNRCLIEQLPDNADVAIVLNPALDSRDLLATVCDELNIGLPQSDDRPGLKVLTDALHKFLLENHGRGRKTVLIIDEAQHLDYEVLEQIRLLTNLETHDEKLLHIILIGQPELADKLRRPELRQLNQRISARYDLQPLTVEETGGYIRHRLQVAGMGAGRDLFPTRLVRRIHHRSRGIPRLINLLCDRMLLGAYGQGSERVDVRLLRRASREVLGEEGEGASVVKWLIAGIAGLTVLGIALTLLLRDAPDRPELAVSSQPVAVQAVPPAPAIAPPPVEANTDWQLTPLLGSKVLASLYGVTSEVADPCLLPLSSALRCVSDEAETWDALLAENRPLLLELRDSRRFAARALFLGIDGTEVLLVDEPGFRRVPLETVAQHWTGGYWYYWRPPSDWVGAVGPGDRGESVRLVAQLFARLDGQERLLTETEYSDTLAQRVRIFQRGEGLKVDGVAGEQTVRALVLAAGEDLSRQAALSDIQSRAAAGQWP